MSKSDTRNYGKFHPRFAEGGAVRKNLQQHWGKVGTDMFEGMRKAWTNPDGTLKPRENVVSSSTDDTSPAKLGPAADFILPARRAPVPPTGDPDDR